MFSRVNIEASDLGGYGTVSRNTAHRGSGVCNSWLCNVRGVAGSGLGVHHVVVAGFRTCVGAGGPMKTNNLRYGPAAHLGCSGLAV